MATEAEFWGRPEGAGAAASAQAARAHLVREALALVADDAKDRGMLNTFAVVAGMAQHADDYALAKLGRLIR